MLIDCLAVGFGGFIGSILRYLVGILTPSASSFPWTTLGVNVLGSFLLAVIAGQVLKGAISSERLSLLLRVGLCGGFTTFSTFSLEVTELATSGSTIQAAIYAVLTCALCILAAFAGSWLTRA